MVCRPSCVFCKRHTKRARTTVIWEVEGEAVGWSWLKIHENEFFKGGTYGEANEIYVARKWCRKKMGTMMMHAFNWFKERGVNTIRVEALACNRAAVSFYRRLGFKPNYIVPQRELVKKTPTFGLTTFTRRLFS